MLKESILNDPQISKTEKDYLIAYIDSQNRIRRIFRWACYAIWIGLGFLVGLSYSVWAGVCISAAFVAGQFLEQNKEIK